MSVVNSLVPNKLYDSPSADGMLTQYRVVKPLDPHSFEPNIDEILHSLPNINRYNGHAIRAYSVAEHSLNCMIIGALQYKLVRPHQQLYLLLHDAAECYLQDIIRPIKKYSSDAILIAEEVIFDNLIALIPFEEWQRESFKDQDFIDVVKEIDTRMAVTEVEHLFNVQNVIPGFESYNMTIPYQQSINIEKMYRNAVWRGLNHLYEYV